MYSVLDIMLYCSITNYLALYHHTTSTLHCTAAAIFVLIPLQEQQPCYTQFEDPLAMTRHCLISFEGSLKACSLCGRQTGLYSVCMYLQGALLSSDSILTVSKGYAHDITHDLDASCGLLHVLSSKPVR